MSDSTPTERSTGITSHHLYYVLAAVEVLTIVVCLALSHQSLRVYTLSLGEQHEWRDRQARLSQLADLAAMVNAPGNDVFVSRNVEVETQRLHRAWTEYYAMSSSVRTDLGTLVEDALKINDAAFVRHRVEVIREFVDVPPIVTEKHKVLQIAVNLINNAKYAVSDSERHDKTVTVSVAADDESVRIQVRDNGVGIPPENLTRIFSHGFTTRKEGHGFGLHSSALAAQELNGSLSAHSDGTGSGATFTLRLPIEKESLCIR